MKRIIILILVFCMCFSSSFHVFAVNANKNGAENEALTNSAIDIDCKSAVLMDASEGKVIYAKNADAAYSPASVTKIMTLLLVVEALDDGAFKLTDTVTVSDYAASMGGSQVFLEAGEKIIVEDLIKCTVIASANDAAVALAELVSGSESAFVAKMNAKAMELSMKSTNFENVTGLDDDTVNHVTSAMDIAIMSCELIKHDIILKYSSIWQDTIRGGAFTLTNTNRLVRFYDGCNGLKTGSTAKAGYCISATAKRDGMQLISVIMGAETRDKRNEAARTLLDYGFSSYSIYSVEERALEEVPISRGVRGSIMLYSAPFSSLIAKSDKNKIEMKYTLPDKISAPVNEMEAVGRVEYICGGKVIGESAVYAKESIGKITFGELYSKILFWIFGK